MATARVKYWIDSPIYSEDRPGAQVTIGDDDIDDLRRAYEQRSLISLDHCANVERGKRYRVAAPPRRASQAPDRVDYDVRVETAQ